MNYKIVIPGTFPSLNEYLHQCNRHPIEGNRCKQESQFAIEMIARSTMCGIKMNEPVKIHYTYYEPNEKRDLDNVSGFFHKVFQDALVKGKVLQNDGWKNIKGFTDTFHCDRENPRIEVELEEVEGA